MRLVQLPNMLTILPSRSRPLNVGVVLSDWIEMDNFSDIVVVIDADDPARRAYEKVWNTYHEKMGSRLRWMMIPKWESLAWKLNHALYRCLGWQEGYSVIGFMGDDHRPRTEDWDIKISQLPEPFMAYGDDLHQGESLPTSIWGSRSVWQNLGYMCPPGFSHLYIDNVWKEIGQRSGILKYLPDVVVEHVHPLAGKTAWDAQYHRVNELSDYQTGEGLFQDYVAHSLHRAVTAMVNLRQVAERLEAPTPAPPSSPA